MRSTNGIVTVCLAVAVLFAACAGPTPSTPSAPADPARPAVFKRVVVGRVGGDPEFLVRPGNGRIASYGEMVSAGLTSYDDAGVIHAELAEAVPTLDNGLLRVFSDGRMETTWRIRPGAEWHDGMPVTAEDMVFSAKLGLEKRLPVFAFVGYDFIDSVEAVDTSIVLVRWKRPYIDAEAMFNRKLGGSHFALPQPRHLLEEAYRDSPTTFTDLRFFTTEYVGAGPFKLKEWNPGAYITFAANDRYVLGRPKLDEIEVRFFGDPNALIAAALSGDVLGSVDTGPVTAEEGVRLKERWRDGNVLIRFTAWIVMNPQFIDPRPAALADVRFRRALLHAIDRQALSDSIMAGLAPVGHAPIPLGHPATEQLERFVIKYEYDPRRATSLLETLGFRTTEGALRDASGEALTLEIRGGQAPGEEGRLALAVADYWKQLGIATNLGVQPAQFSSAREFQNDRPGFLIRRTGNALERLDQLSSVEVPTRENQWRGNNFSRYTTPEMEELLNRFFSTIPLPDRYQAAGEIMRVLTDQVAMFGLVYNSDTTLVNNRLKNVKGRTQPADVYGIHQWDLE